MGDFFSLGHQGEPWREDYPWSKEGSSYISIQSWALAVIFIFLFIKEQSWALPVFLNFFTNKK